MLINCLVGMAVHAVKSLLSRGLKCLTLLSEVLLVHKPQVCTTDRGNSSCTKLL